MRRNRMLSHAKTNKGLYEQNAYPGFVFINKIPFNPDPSHIPSLNARYVTVHQKTKAIIMYNNSKSRAFFPASPR